MRKILSVVFSLMLLSSCDDPVKVINYDDDNLSMVDEEQKKSDDAAQTRHEAAAESECETAFCKEMKQLAKAALEDDK